MPGGLPGCSRRGHLRAAPRSPATASRGLGPAVGASLLCPGRGGGCRQPLPAGSIGLGSLLGCCLPRCRLSWLGPRGAGGTPVRPSPPGPVAGGSGQQLGHIRAGNRLLSQHGFLLPENPIKPHFSDPNLSLPCGRD